MSPVTPAQFYKDAASIFKESVADAYKDLLEAAIAVERAAILNILDEHCRSVDVREAVEIIKARSKA